MISKFEIYIDRAGGYRWRLKARNGEIVAIGESYTTKYNAIKSAKLIKVIAPYASITELR